jgi:hypothetical protein
MLGAAEGNPTSKAKPSAFDLVFALLYPSLYQAEHRSV